MQILIWTSALYEYSEEPIFFDFMHKHTEITVVQCWEHNIALMVFTLEGHVVLSFTSFIQRCLSNTSRRPFMDVHFYTGIFNLSLTNNYSSYQYILITIIPSNTMIVYSNILSWKIEWGLNLSICQDLWVMGFFASFLLDFFLIFIFHHLLKDYSSVVLKRHWQIWVIRLEQDGLFVLINF